MHTHKIDSYCWVLPVVSQVHRSSWSSVSSKLRCKMAQGGHLTKKRHIFTDHLGEDAKIFPGTETSNTLPILYSGHSSSKKDNTEIKLNFLLTWLQLSERDNTRKGFSLMSIIPRKFSLTGRFYIQQVERKTKCYHDWACISWYLKKHLFPKGEH